MVESKKELKRVLSKEFNLYFHSRWMYLRSILLYSRTYNIWKYQKALRYLEYYKSRMSQRGKLLDKLLFSFYSRKVNNQGLKLGIDTWCGVFDEGLLIFHTAGGIIVNSESRIGKNCHLHGQNCIGNNGSPNGKSPVIGDNCMIGVGAKIIGEVIIGNNIKIAAGAVVVKSCIENGVTLAGVPAVVISK